MPVAPPRHDCKWSAEVLDLLRWRLDPGHPSPVEGPLFDPFAGVAHGVDSLGRPDWSGIEIEPEWAAVHPSVSEGDARCLACYPDGIGAVVTSPTYGNRMADQYPGRRCPDCEGSRIEPGSKVAILNCVTCEGSGIDPADRRYGYAPSLRRRVSTGSSAAMQWGNAYRNFHRAWLLVLARVLRPGPARLIVNMGDHVRDDQRQFVIAWWITAALGHGFGLAESHPVDTRGMGYGQNYDARTGGEVVMVFDFGGSR